MEPILLFTGASANTLEYAVDYLSIYLLGTIFVEISTGLNSFINAQGRPAIAMFSVLIGALLNIILDPIFIFIFKWGMMGAAVATVIGQVATAFLAVWYLLHMKIIKPASGDYALRWSICGRMLTLGITSFLSQISLVAAMAAINNMLRKYGALDAVFGQEQYAQIPMAVVGIVMKFFQIVISIVVGMAAGCIPIVGYNMGAEKKLRVRELFTTLLVAEALVGAVALVLAEGFPRQLIAIFGADNESSYYTDFAQALPKDTVILTAGCAKYRYNKLNLGDINGIPRVLDAGQCNDSYSLAVIAMKLQEVFGLEDINELPIIYNIAWYEQKAVIVLLALLSLGVKNIHLGPTLPAFLSPNVTKILVNNFGIAGISSVEEDMELFFGK